VSYALADRAVVEGTGFCSRGFVEGTVREQSFVAVLCLCFSVDSRPAIGSMGV